MRDVQSIYCITWYCEVEIKCTAGFFYLFSRNTFGQLCPNAHSLIIYHIVTYQQCYSSGEVYTNQSACAGKLGEICRYTLSVHERGKIAYGGSWTCPCTVSSAARQLRDFADKGSSFVMHGLVLKVALNGFRHRIGFPLWCFRGWSTLCRPTTQ